MGVYVAAVAVVVVNLYVLFNTYRWDWFTLLIQAISILFFWFWTGVWTSTTGSQYFYKAGAEVFGQLSFWALLLVTVIICLLPRFTAMSCQKVFFPRDVDIIREQVKQGKFDYLKDERNTDTPPLDEKSLSHDSASDGSKARERSETHADSTRPIIAPSTGRTETTNGAADHNESLRRPQDMSRLSVDLHRLSTGASPRPSSERPRQSFERSRQSMDRLRP